MSFNCKIINFNRHIGTTHDRPARLFLKQPKPRARQIGIPDLYCLTYSEKNVPHVRARTHVPLIYSQGILSLFLSFSLLAGPADIDRERRNGILRLG